MRKGLEHCGWRFLYQVLVTLLMCAHTATPTSSSTLVKDWDELAPRCDAWELKVLMILSKISWYGSGSRYIQVPKSTRHFI
ncbi:hypothetical protein GGI43DRAFT_403334 [Trichoderma evansii]